MDITKINSLTPPANLDGQTTHGAGDEEASTASAFDEALTRELALFTLDAPSSHEADLAPADASAVLAATNALANLEGMALPEAAGAPGEAAAVWAGEGPLQPTPVPPVILFGAATIAPGPALTSMEAISPAWDAEASRARQAAKEAGMDEPLVSAEPVNEAPVRDALGSRELLKARNAEGQHASLKASEQCLDPAPSTGAGAALGHAEPTSPAHSSTTFSGTSPVTLGSGFIPSSHAGLSDALPAPATARIETPIGASGWGGAFQHKIVWLIDRQQQSAELHVNPPHLGPVDVFLNFSESGTHIAFYSPHAAVREAIEATLSDLRTALSERGLALGEALVSADSHHASEQFSRHGGRDTRHGNTVFGATSSEPLQARRVSLGLIDTFA